MLSSNSSRWRAPGNAGALGGQPRRFGKRELERLAFIRHARDLGLTIESIRQLIKLSGHQDRPCGDADRIDREQLAAVRERIDRLRKLEVELKRIATCCTGETVGDLLRSEPSFSSLPSG